MSRSDRHRGRRDGVSAGARAPAGATVLVLCLVQFIDVLGVTSTTTAIPAILRGVAAPSSAAGLVATVYAMFFGGLLVLGARLGDRYGARRVLGAGIAAFALVSLVGATATGLSQVLLARALQGAAAAISVPAALHMLLHVTPDVGARRRALAAWSATGGAAGAAGFIVGGVLAQVLGWRSVFWVNAPVAAFLFAGVVLLVPALAAGQRGERLDVLGIVLLIVAVMALVIGAGALQGPGTRVSGVALAVAGVLVGAGFALWQRVAAQPLVPLAAFRSAHLRTGTAVSFVNTAGTSSAAVLATLLLQDQLGVSPIRAGLDLLPISVGAVTGSALAGPLSRRSSSRRLTALGLVGIAAGILLLAAAASTPWGVPAGAAVTGAGLGLASVGANTIGTSVPPNLSASATGVLNTGAQLGTALGVAAVVLLADATSSALAWVVTAAAVTACALVLLRRGEEAGQATAEETGLRVR